MTPHSMPVTVVPMEVLDAIKSRRSVRSYSDRTVPEEVLTRILEAGRIAPSANNRQPWHFVVVQDPERRKALSGGRWAGFLKECPVVIAGCGDKTRSPEWYAVDVTIALQNMVTQATAEGIGTCWIGSFDEATVKEALDVPENFSVVAMLAVGYASDKPKAERKARPMGEVVSRDRFGPG